MSSEVAAATSSPNQQEDHSSSPEQQISRCLVYCRLRPDHPNDYAEGGIPLLKLDKDQVHVADEKSYDFDGTFGQDSKQTDLFENIGKPTVDHCMKSRGSLLAYGQTGSGKTHTMIGRHTCPENSGLLPRCIDYLFDQVEKLSSEKQIKFTISTQLVQIYRDHLGDLMSEEGKARVEIHFDAATGVTLPGCSTFEVTSRQQFMEMFESAYKNRVTVATKMNPESSRGHAAFVLWISSKSTDTESVAETKGKMTFIDLAGYERFSKTGISTSDTVRKDEAKTINASLLALGHVVSSLSNQEKHVPWRNSKLTRLLQDSIGGRSRTSILLTVGPSSDHLFETTNTLQFGQRAMAVRVASKVQVIVDWRKHAVKLQALLDEKQSRIDELQQQLAGCVAAESELILRQQKDIDALREKHAEEMAVLKVSEGATDDRIEHLRDQQNVEAELLYTQQAEERAYEEAKIEEEEYEHDHPTSSQEQQQQEKEELGQEEEGKEEGKEIIQERENSSQSISLADTFSPSATSRNTTNASKDEIIADLKRQVRLYKMKLLVPEKYRATSEMIEHEALANTSQLLNLSLTNTADGNSNPDFNSAILSSSASNEKNGVVNAAATIGSESDLKEQNKTYEKEKEEEEEMIPKIKFDTMKKCLESEIENLNEILNQKLDLSTFATMVDSIELKSLSTTTTTKEETEQLEEKTSTSTSNPENRVASYIAAMQRRIQDLTQRLDVSEKKVRDQRSSNADNITDEKEEVVVEKQQQQQQQHVDPSTSSSSAPEKDEKTLLKNLISKEEANQLVTDSFSKFMSEYYSASLLEFKQTLCEQISQVHSTFFENSHQMLHLAATEKEFFETELETAKMDMEMALEGHNESLMQAITNAREEAEAKFKVEKLSWEEDMSQNLQEAGKEAAEKEKIVAQEEILLLQGEVAKLKSNFSEKVKEVENYKIQVAEAEAEAAVATAATEEAKTAAEQQQKLLQQQQKEREEEKKKRQQEEKEKQQQQDSSSSSSTTKVDDDDDSSQNPILAQLDTVLMPVLKSKTELLDDLTDILTSTGAISNTSSSSSSSSSHGQLVSFVEKMKQQQENENNNSNNQMLHHSLPSNLPQSLLKIVKRLRSSTKDAETKWLKCVVALAKISKKISTLLTNANSTNNTSHNSVKIASDIMNAINLALFPEKTTTTVSENSSSSSSSQPKTANAHLLNRGRNRGMSEAETARRALGETILQSTVAGETQVAEQKALQAVILSQQEEIARIDGDVVDLAMENARTKLQVRFDKVLSSMFEEATTTTSAATKIVSSSQAENQKDNNNNNNLVEEIIKVQKTEFLSQKEKENKSELEYYRLKSTLLEKQLRTQLNELAKQYNSNNNTSSSSTEQQQPQQSRSQIVQKMEQEQIQKEISTASSSIVADMEMITSCREAELRVLSAKLETMEREMNFYKSNANMISAAGNNSSNSASSSAAPDSHQHHQSSSSSSSSVYHMLRNLRKENSILHSVIRERGLLLRKYALTLMRYQLLPPNFDINKVAGDVHSELRLAFAERDEEIFLKEQSLNMRSTQVIVLEESLQALIDQLQKADMTPCRPNSRFSAELQQTRNELEIKLSGKQEQREDLKKKIDRMTTELTKVEQKISNEQQQQSNKSSSSSTASGSGGPVNTHSQAAATSASDALLVLRLQKDHLSHSKNISEVQLGALESEMGILKQSVMSASSTQSIEAAIENRDEQENTSMMSRLFRKFK